MNESSKLWRKALTYLCVVWLTLTGNYFYSWLLFNYPLTNRSSTNLRVDRIINSCTFSQMNNNMQKRNLGYMSRFELNAALYIFTGQDDLVWADDMWAYLMFSLLNNFIPNVTPAFSCFYYMCPLPDPVCVCSCWQLGGNGSSDHSALKHMQQQTLLQTDSIIIFYVTWFMLFGCACVQTTEKGQNTVCVRSPNIIISWFQWKDCKCFGCYQELIQKTLEV